MIILMPTVLLIGMSNITGIQILTPQNQEQKVLNSIVCGAVADFLLNLVLIPKMASSGAALATVIAELVVLLVQCVYLKEILKDIMRDVSGMKIGAAIVVATIGGSLVKGLLDLESSGWSMEIQSFVMLAISACVFFGIYGVVLLMTKEKLVWEIVGNYIEKK
jgi:O-antigen/teichoic acid export membrane protein